MTIREHFTKEEWTGIIQAPLLAGMAVTAADPGGLWSVIKEGSTLAKSIAGNATASASESLRAEIAEAFQGSEGRDIARDGMKKVLKGKRPEEATKVAVQRLHEIADLVAAKAPAQAEEFRHWLRDIAHEVADSANEGTFMGMGGERISKAEQSTLDEIDRMLH